MTMNIIGRALAQNRSVEVRVANFMMGSEAIVIYYADIISSAVSK